MVKHTPAEQREHLVLMARGSRLLGRDQQAETLELVLAHFPVEGFPDDSTYYDMLDSYCGEIDTAKQNWFSQ